jgi:hypothetical protein
MPSSTERLTSLESLHQPRNYWQSVCPFS